MKSNLDIRQKLVQKRIWVEDRKAPAQKFPIIPAFLLCRLLLLYLELLVIFHTLQHHTLPNKLEDLFPRLFIKFSFEFLGIHVPDFWQGSCTIHTFQEKILF